jgi:antitoxin component of RelBE/YafQ-DinJ toxin-antitoxin module
MDEPVRGFIAAGATQAPLKERLRNYLQAVLPKPLEGILEHHLEKVALWAGLAFTAVLLMPLLSILALSLLVKLLPSAIGDWAHVNFVSAIHSGYDIDKVSERLKREASDDAVRRLVNNNMSLDYVQYVEFFLARTDQSKEIPIQLNMGQHAEITVRRNQIVRNPESRDPNCQLSDVPVSAPVLSVNFGRLSIASLPAMLMPGPNGDISLSKDWWAQNLNRVKAETSHASGVIPMISFGKTADFEHSMTECTALKIEATVEVFKVDP